MFNAVFCSNTNKEHGRQISTFCSQRLETDSLIQTHAKWANYLQAPNVMERPAGLEGRRAGEIDRSASSAKQTTQNRVRFCGVFPLVALHAQSVILDKA